MFVNQFTHQNLLEYETVLGISVKIPDKQRAVPNMLWL